jgi:hypothetical protein
MQNRCVVPFISKIIKRKSAKKFLRGVSLPQHIDNETRVLPITLNLELNRDNSCHIYCFVKYWAAGQILTPRQFINLFLA